MKKAIKTLLLIGLFTPSLFSQTDENDKLVKKNEKIEKRYIHPKSKYISTSAAIGFTSTHVKDPNGFFNEGLTMLNNTYVPSIMYEHGIKNNFFAEVGYAYVGQAVNFNRMIDEVGISFAQLVYHNHNIQFGTGYRVINKNNFHFLNIHAGLFFGLAGKSPKFDSFTTLDPITQSFFSVNTKVNQFSPLSFGTYLGVSKEIRISDEVRLFAKYSHFFGFNTIMSGTFELNSDDIIFNHDASFNVKGGAAFFMGGLKVLLFKNKLN